MLQKIKAADYYLPDSLGLSLECKALLKKLLHPDWKARVKIPEIMADPWFKADLPPDALNMNDRYIANTRTCQQSEDGAWSRSAMMRGLPWFAAAAAAAAVVSHVMGVSALWAVTDCRQGSAQSSYPHVCCLLLPCSSAADIRKIVAAAIQNNMNDMSMGMDQCL